MMPEHRSGAQPDEPLPETIHGARVRAGVARRDVADPLYERSWGDPRQGTIVSSHTQTAFDIVGAGRIWADHGREIVVEAGAGDRPAPWLFGTVGAFVLAQQGRFALHANVVEVNGKAIAIAGARRAGKSTTALAMLAAGHRLVTDDVAPLDIAGDTVVHHPTGRPIHVHPASARRLGVSVAGGLTVAGDPSKVALPNPRTEAVPLAAIVLLVAGDDPTTDVAFAALGPAAAAAEIHQNAYRRLLVSPLWRAELFTWATAVAQRVPVQILHRPAERWTTDAVRGALESLSSGDGPVRP